MLKKKFIPHLLMSAAAVAAFVLLFALKVPEFKFLLILFVQFLFILSVRLYDYRFSSAYFAITILAFFIFVKVPVEFGLYKYINLGVYVFIGYLMYYFVRAVDEELHGNRNFIEEEEENLEVQRKRNEEAVKKSQALKEQTLVWHLLSNMLNKSMSLSDFREITVFFTQQTGKLFPGAAVFFSLRDASQGPAFATYETSLKEPDLRDKIFDNVDDGVHASQTPFFVEDIATEIHHRVALDRNMLGPISFASLMVVPVTINESFAGVLKCYHPHKARYQNTDLRLLQYVGEMIGIQLLNSLLVRETERLARTDGITGLFVQYYFVEKVREEIYRCQNSGSTFSLLVIDIDKFKLFNDNFGHLAGDLVLVRTADIIRASIRTSDFPSRYGGDEFFLILPETDQAGAESLAERIRIRIFEETRDLKLGETVIDRNVTVSVGVKQYEKSDGEWKEFVAKVDDLMYKAKTTGRNKVVGPSHG